MELQNFINGEFTSAGSAKTFSKVSPFDGLIISQVAYSDPMDVIKAIQSAKKAATTFKDVSREDRASLLTKMSQYLQTHKEDIALAEALNQGLPKDFVLNKSIEPIIFLLDQTAASLTAELPSDILLQPTGVMGIITSWNLSFRLVMESLVPALAAGNTMLIKVSEHSPITAQVIGEMCKTVEVPVGVVNLIQGFSDVAELIAGHPGIHAIAATGSSPTMSSVAKAGFSTFKKLQLSGSTKNPVFILSDSDYQNKVPLILESVLLGQGQLCWNSSRIFVLESVLPEFLTALKEYLATLKPLQSPLGQSVWTPMISANAVEAVVARTQVAKSEGAKIVAGDEVLSGDGFYVRPTFTLDLSNCSTLQQDEVLGPLCLITAVKYQHEMVKWANNSYLGHSAVIWGSEEKALKVASQIEYSDISLNQWMPSNQGKVFGLKQASFGNGDMNWFGSFYSNVKKLTAAH